MPACPRARFIWVHAHNEQDSAFHVGAAKAGAWVEFDGIADDSITRHVELVRQMKAEGLLGRVLLSHDAGWYHVGEPGGGSSGLTLPCSRWSPRSWTLA